MPLSNPSLPRLFPLATGPRVLFFIHQITNINYVNLRSRGDSIEKPQNRRSFPVPHSNFPASSSLRGGGIRIAARPHVVDRKTAPKTRRSGNLRGELENDRIHDEIPTKLGFGRRRIFAFFDEISREPPALLRLLLLLLLLWMNLHHEK